VHTTPLMQSLLGSGLLFLLGGVTFGGAGRGARSRLAAVGASSPACFARVGSQPGVRDEPARQGHRRHVLVRHVLRCAAGSAPRSPLCARRRTASDAGAQHLFRHLATKAVRVYMQVGGSASRACRVLIARARAQDKSCGFRSTGLVNTVNFVWLNFCAQRTGRLERCRLTQGLLLPQTGSSTAPFSPPSETAMCSSHCRQPTYADLPLSAER
jgi:hypothetical protein